MKTLLIGLIALILTGCNPSESSGKENEPVKHLNINGGRGTVDYKVIVIDGNEYFVCKTNNDFWVLCPKLPPKSN